MTALRFPHNNNNKNVLIKFVCYCYAKHNVLNLFRLPQLTVAIELVNEISRQLMERKTEAVNEISCTFEELERVLHQRKTALITDLENIYSSKQKVRNGVFPL